MKDEKQLEIIKNDNSISIAKNEADGMNGTMALNANHNSLRNCIKINIIKSFMSNSRELAKETLTFLVDELKSEILRSYPAIRLEEICLAIHKGSIGDYGQVYNLSLNAFVGFIREYMNSEARLTASKDFLKIDTEKPQNKPSADELAKANKQNVLNAFDAYKSHGFYNDYGNYIFDQLANYGILNFTEDDKVKIWKKAKRNVFNSFQKIALTIDQRNERARRLKELKENPDHTLFYIEAKKIALIHFFAELVLMDTELTDLIEN
ncbi:MAG: hypothetical protein P4L31_07660 [Candidatus Babeliales bacterium]|nr:hypothetical protein [Candidatus Babeliales bacterium]